MLGLSLLAYFAYHTVEGERGVLAWMRLQTQIAEVDARLAKVEDERDRLERRVRLLRPDHLDPDMLEERARVGLDMVHPDEVVVVEETKAP